MSGTPAPRRSLRDLADVIRGVVPAKPVEGKGGLPFFGISEITAGGLSEPRFVAVDDGLPTAPRLMTGDVVLSLMGSIGASALVTPHHDGAVLGRECALLRAVAPEITGPWLYVWTQSADFQQQAQRHASGTTMPRLSLKALGDFTLPVPDPDVQVTVRDVLAGFDDALAKTGRVLEELTELRRVQIDVFLTDTGAN